MPVAKSSAKRKKKPAQAARGMTFDALRRQGLRLPGVEAGTSYGTPALKVKGKFLLRLREDGETVAVKVPFDERDLLLAADPEVFYLTDHYRGYPAILVRLSAVRPDQLDDLLELAWRFVAPKRLLAELERQSP